MNFLSNYSVEQVQIWTLQFAMLCLTASLITINYQFNKLKKNFREMVKITELMSVLLTGKALSDIASEVSKEKKEKIF